MAGNILEKQERDIFDKLQMTKGKVKRKILQPTWSGTGHELLEKMLIPKISDLSTTNCYLAGHCFDNVCQI